MARVAGTKALASPAVRQRARRRNVDGCASRRFVPGGRISHADDRHIAAEPLGQPAFAPVGATTKVKMNAGRNQLLAW